MKRLNIELSNGRLLFLDMVKSYDLRCTDGGHVGVFEIKKEGDRSTVLINWDHVLVVSCIDKEDKDDAEIH